MLFCGSIYVCDKLKLPIRNKMFMIWGFMMPYLPTHKFFVKFIGYG